MSDSAGIYVYQNGKMVPAATVSGQAGATGPAGPTGPAGQAGNLWYSGSGVPSNSLGVIGDCYINNTTGDYYQKTAPTTWTLNANLKGPQGIQGPTGPTGATGPAGTVQTVKGGAGISVDATDPANPKVNALNSGNDGNLTVDPYWELGISNIPGTTYASTDTTNVTQTNVPRGKVRILPSGYDFFDAPDGQGFPLKPGDQFYLEADVAHKGTDTNSLTLRLWAGSDEQSAAAGTGWDYVLAATATTASAQDTWIHISGVATVPATTQSGSVTGVPPRFGWIGLGTGGPTGGTGWQVANFKARRVMTSASEINVPVGGDLTGSLPNPTIAPGKVTASKLSVSVGGGNLLTNSSFEDPNAGTSGWSPDVNTPTLAIDATTAWSGSRSLSATATTTGDIAFKLASGLTLQPSTTYTLSYYLKTSANARKTSVDITATNFTQNNNVNVASSTSWARYMVTFTTSSNIGNSLTFYFHNAAVGGSAIGDSVWIDCVQLEIGDVATAWKPKADEIFPGTTSQYYRGDKTWVTLDKTAVGLANVDNTSDVNKPVSTAQQTALNAKANLSGATFTGTTTVQADNSYLGVDTTTPRLGFSKKAGTGPKLAYANGPFTVTQYVGQTDITATNAQTDRFSIDVNGNAAFTCPTLTNNGTAVSMAGHTHVATDVNSGVFSTAPLGTGTGSSSNWLRGDGVWSALPVGTLASLSDVTISAPASGQVLRYNGTAWVNAVLAQSDISGLVTALSGKEPTITAGTTSQYWRGDKTWVTLDKTAVGLNNVDNTSDVNKPVSTATQTALNNKENSLGTGSTSQFLRGDKTFAAPTSLGNIGYSANVGANTGNYTRVATFTTTVQYGEVTSDFDIMANGNGGTPSSFMEVMLRIKQMGAMGAAPSVNVSIGNVTNFAPTDLTAVVTVNTAGTTTVELWLRIPVAQEQIFYYDEGTSTFGATFSFEQNGANQAAMPTGTQTVGAFKAIQTGRMGTGTANNTTYLRGDGTWATAGTDNTTLASANKGAFSNATAYNKGDIVSYNNKDYIASTAIAAGTNSTSTPTYVTTVNTANPPGATSTTLTLPSNLKVGDVMSMVTLIVTGISTSNPAVTVTGGGGAGWTVQNAYNSNQGSQYVNVHHLTKIAEAADINATITLATDSNHEITGFVRVFTSAAITGSYEQERNGVNPTTLATTPASGTTLIDHAFAATNGGGSQLVAGAPTFDAGLPLNQWYLNASSGTYIFGAASESYSSGATTAKVFNIAGTTTDLWEVASLSLTGVTVNSNSTPDQDGRWLALPFIPSVDVPQTINSSNKGTYNGTNSYNKGDIVTYNGRMYRANKNTSPVLGVVAYPPVNQSTREFTIPNSAVVGDTVYIVQESTSTGASLSIVQGATAITTGAWFAALSSAPYMKGYSFTVGAAGSSTAPGNVITISGAPSDMNFLVVVVRGVYSTNTPLVTSVTSATPATNNNMNGINGNAVMHIWAGYPTGTENQTDVVTAGQGLNDMGYARQTASPGTGLIAVAFDYSYTGTLNTKTLTGVSASTVWNTAAFAFNMAKLNTVINPVDWDAVPVTNSGATETNLIYKTTQTSRVSLTTLTNDPDLQAYLAPGGIYRIKLGIVVYSAVSNSGNFAYKLFSTSGTPTVAANMVYTNTTNNPATGAVVLNTAYASYGTSNYSMVNIDGVVTNSANGTVLQFQWSQNVSNTTATVVMPGSFMELTRLA